MIFRTRALPAKRLFDLSLLILSAPVLVVLGIVALLVRKNLGSPVLFRQRRLGKDGRVFELVKFRSMTDARGWDGELLPDAERLPPFGLWLRSTSLDELPELFNILKGEMSFVGPRPLLVEYLPHYTTRQARRHDVLPGLTGWAQINGRNALPWDDRLELDAWYAENHSLKLDLLIIWRTLFKVLKRSDISFDGAATMEPFTGTRGGEGEAASRADISRTLGKTE